MISTEVLMALAAFALVSSITPGPNNLMLMASGANFGFARTIPHLLGVSIGFTLMICLVGAGLHQIFDAMPWTYTVLKVVSIGYLAYLAFKIATALPPAEPAKRASGGAISKPFTFLQAVLFQWVNPKAWTMALTVCSTYVPLNHPVAGLGLVAGVCGVINLPSVSVWTIMGVQLRQLLSDRRRQRTFNALAALLLLASLYPVIFTKV